MAVQPAIRLMRTEVLISLHFIAAAAKAIVNILMKSCILMQNAARIELKLAKGHRTFTPVNGIERCIGLVFHIRSVCIHVTENTCPKLFPFNLPCHYDGNIDPLLHRIAPGGPIFHAEIGHDLFPDFLWYLYFLADTCHTHYYALF